MIPTTACAQRRINCSQLLNSGFIRSPQKDQRWGSLRADYMTGPSEFAGRVAIVTGASSGIGQATAEMLADRGARVTIFARSAEKLKAIAGRSKNLLAVGGDIGDRDAVDRLFAETESRFGPCDILINNAGTYVARRLEKMSVEDWDSVFQVNLRGAFLASRRAMPSMIAKRNGTIVNVASISG